MTDLIYPQNAELNLINQDLLPRLLADRPIFQHMPMVNHDTSIVMWEQLDNYRGLQQVRGLNGAPPQVKHVALNRYNSNPGAYGEFSLIDERELVERRRLGTFATAIDITDLVVISQRQLLVRRLDRTESIIWTLLGTGTFAVTGPMGAILHTDSYTTQTFTSAVTWSTPGTATPLADLRAVKVLHRGHSVRFDHTARAYLNLVTMNEMLANTNAADLYGRRVEGFATINSAGQVNELMTRDDLPNFAVYDEGYISDTGVFVPFIPNGVVIVIGRRTDGAPIGEFQMVRNAQNPNMDPGPYMKVIDRGENNVPRSIEVHDGFSGGPAITFPSAVVTMTVG